jgi:hypothetical protein
VLECSEVAKPQKTGNLLKLQTRQGLAYAGYEGVLKMRLGQRGGNLGIASHRPEHQEQPHIQPSGLVPKLPLLGPFLRQGWSV